MIIRQLGKEVLFERMYFKFKILPKNSSIFVDIKVLSKKYKATM
jgi:hypothetical protein